MPLDPNCFQVPADDAHFRNTSRDPYALWHGRALESLPYDEVCNGLADYLRTFYKVVWDALTPHRHQWYLAREEGLLAWCRYEAICRLNCDYRETYSIIEFHELIFKEDLHRDGQKALQDPFWTPLFLLKKKEGDLEFFKHLPILVGQREQPMHQGIRRLAIGWDRETIPLSFWNYPAIAKRIEWEAKRKVASENTLRQWAHLLELKQQKPLVITGYNGPWPIIDEAAFEYHEIP